MKKTISLIGCLFFLSFCAQMKSRILPYPEGIVFPVEEEGDINYEGEVFNGLFQQEELLLLATREGDVYGFSRSDNSLQWRTQIGGPLSGPLQVGEDLLFVSDSNSTLYCLDLYGNTLWRKSLEDRITSPAAKIGEAVYFGTEEGFLVALNRDDGQERWRYSAGTAIHSFPVGVEENIVFGCEDQHLYVLDKKGTLVNRYRIQGRIGATLCTDGQLLYFGTENEYFICFDLKMGIVRWKVRTGGRLSFSPLIFDKNIYVLAGNGVVQCFHRFTGVALWWRAIPARIPYRLLLAEDKIVVSSLSSTLICLDALTGNTVGQADVGGEMKSNALWIPPYLLVCVNDPGTESEKISIMKKQVKLTLSSSLQPPQEVNNEILFTAEAIGFHNPQFEFFFKENQTRKIVQEWSEQSGWTWFPSDPGLYSVGVAAKDERQHGEAEVAFVIEKEKPQLSLTPSIPSPQPTNREIALSASTSGLVEPEFEFQIFRLIRIPFGIGGLLPVETEDDKEISRKLQETGRWTWIPLKEGLFLIKVAASDGETKVESSILFLISKRKN